MCYASSEKSSAYLSVSLNLGGQSFSLTDINKAGQTSDDIFVRDIQIFQVDFGLALNKIFRLLIILGQAFKQNKILRLTCHKSDLFLINKFPSLLSLSMKYSNVKC